MSSLPRRQPLDERRRQGGGMPGRRPPDDNRRGLNRLPWRGRDERDQERRIERLRQTRRMPRLWYEVSLRLVVAQLIGLVIIAAPVFFILFGGSSVTPWSVVAHWTPSEAALRLGGLVVFIGTLSLLVGYRATQEMTRPVQDLATQIRRFGAGDFEARIDTSKMREPHELVEIAEAFNAMAADLQVAETARTNVMADVSHELRTPLTVLEGSLRAALDRVYALDEAEIANLYGQTRHLIRLVNDLHELALADAHRLPLDLQPTDVVDLVEETLRSFAPLAEEQGVALRGDLARLPLVTLDAVRIRQVLHNLISNALRHTPCGGAVTLAGAMEDEHVTLAVADTGDGLEAEHVSAIFDRFYRADKSRSRDTGGAGLGLAIASALMAAHGGSIVAASPGPGQGSTFTLRLPLEPPAPGDEPA